MRLISTRKRSTETLSIAAAETWQNSFGIWVLDDISLSKVVIKNRDTYILTQRVEAQLRS